MIPNDYLEKVYAGFLGMNIGIQLGAPVEPTSWTFERINTVYGDIKGYIKPYRNFAADDDVNGPVYFLRALNDDASDRDLIPDDIGRAWLNYAREGIGMFWWGGVGISTEHTAYMNLKKGIAAPKSGSIEVNGEIMAEQIGGQIFIDTWGLVLPCDYKRAAEYGRRAASVSHDGNGLYGAMFMTACISKAFDAKSVHEIIETGLSCIPEESTYAKVVHAVIDFYNKVPKDFRKCMKYLIDQWGYDKYQGVCHIIPNAGVCVLALLYGGGNLSRTVEIATMCGWDTDCNAGNVGTIIGVFQGLEGVEEHYRKPINDGIVLSGVSGYLNILDIPTYAKEIALHGYRLANEVPPKTLLDSFHENEVYFDFELEGSTHNFRLSNPNKFRIQNTDVKSLTGKRSLEVMFDRLVEGVSGRVFYKPFYRREDFDDERYKPTFAPKIYSGQTISMEVYLDQWEGADLVVSSYIRKTYRKEILEIDQHPLDNNKWNTITFTIPDINGDLIDEVGIIITSCGDLKNRSLGRLFIDHFRAYGNAKYTIDFAKQSEEFLCVTPFSHHLGSWHLDGDVLVCESDDSTASYSGNYYAKDIMVKAKIRPISGLCHHILLRAQGIMRGYYFGFSDRNEIAIYKYNYGIQPLVSTEFKWSHNTFYTVEAKAIGQELQLYIDGQMYLTCQDSTFGYGMYGLGALKKGKTLYKDIEVIEC